MRRKIVSARQWFRAWHKHERPKTHCTFVFVEENDSGSIAASSLVSDNFSFLEAMRLLYLLYSLIQDTKKGRSKGKRRGIVIAKKCSIGNSRVSRVVVIDPSFVFMVSLWSDCCCAAIVRAIQSSTSGCNWPVDDLPVSDGEDGSIRVVPVFVSKTSHSIDSPSDSSREDGIYTTRCCDDGLTDDKPWLL